MTTLGIARMTRKNEASSWHPLDLITYATSRTTETRSDKALMIIQDEAGGYELLVAGMDKHQCLIALTAAYEHYLKFNVSKD